METNVRYTIVGGFVVLLTIALIIGVIWLSSGLGSDKHKFYRVYMAESVSGLSKDGPVEYNGVTVGTVASIRLNRQNPHLVELILSIREGTPITQGTIATLNVRGLTGIAFVALKDDSSDLTPLVGTKNQPIPTIKTSPSLFSRLDTGLERITSSLYKLSNSMQSLLDEENQHSFKAILINLQNITKTLDDESENFSKIMHNTAKASESFPTLVKTTEATIKSSQSAVQTFTAQTLPSADRAMGNLDAAIKNILDLTNEIKSNPAMVIRGKQPAPLGPGER